MHGRPRKAPTTEEQEASAIKASKLRSLQSQFLQLHHNKIYTKEALDVSAKLLESNPEYYTAWNYRKLAVQHNLNLPEADNNEESIKSILDEELRLVENALKRNFKSYGAWHHRKWVLSKGHSSTDKELLLLGKFQKADARNFHAWNYRRFVTALKNIPDEKELEYTTERIYDNFSNYSAWHNRSVLLSHLLKEKAKGYSPKDNVFTEEYEFVRNALFTDPDDQSGWFYHLWLLDQTVKLETLVSSWPPHGCNLSLPMDGSFGDCSFSPFTSLQSNTRTLPLILYFSEVVENICSSTVEVECESIVSNELVWRSLSGDETASTHAWLTDLNFPEEHANSLKAYQVKVSLARSQGIFSSTGVHHGNSSHIAFTVSISPYRSEHVDLKNEEKISWNDESFCTHEAQFLESVLANLFHIERTKGDEKVVDYQWNVTTVDNEIAYYRELLATMNCKIGKLTLARLLMAHDTLMSYTGTSHRNFSHHTEILQLYDDLKKMDPAHFHYYQDEYSLVLLKQIISNQDLLLKHCCKYRDPSSPKINNFCLRLNDLSLSRIGSMEKLLWVQVLDLSNNQLQSLEGLEVMQLLTCLNVSHNKLCSFTALEPLRMLRSLKVLDISYNEIGAHSIDTRRYLCSSPLNHKSGGDWKAEEPEMPWDKVADNWEVYTIFKDLNLIQLDVIGNAVSDDKIKLLLIKLLPSLKWLDGEIADN
ncbi:geranylgeranyl transferase type-2 subunit alpha 1 isoform X1 [Nicotiana sylvestris]|uniref:Geranylgeranyl transferase type-2 subunit alpha n=1 Tax=Nicotiana sylvestris TaxID=4096 RepID=A0A1U7WXJ3_NICSY|nr:PREDICTED: geranylgeranyl transferase type-2 subunit alpha isoform X1 [Nicotiana sylvestris]